MPSAVVLKCPVCSRFLAELAPEDIGVRVACHGLSIRVERSLPRDPTTAYAFPPGSDAVRWPFDYERNRVDS